MLETISDQQRAENTVVQAMRYARPGERLEALADAYARADAAAKDALCLALIARVAIAPDRG